MNPLKTCILAATTLAVSTSPAALAAPLSDARPATIEVDSAISESDAFDVLREAGYGDDAISSLVEVSRHVSPTSGRTFVKYEQRTFGRVVHGSYAKVVLEPDGSVSEVSHRIADLKVSGMGFAPGFALDGAVSSAVGQPFGLPSAKIVEKTPSKITFEKGDFYQTEPTASLVWIADEDGTLSSGTLVKAWTKKDNQFVETVVASDGRVVSKENRTSSDSYVAYKVSPGQGNPTVIQGSAANGTASPRGWLYGSSQNSIRIRGYNAEAYVDANIDNYPDGGGRSIGNGVFGTTANLSEAPDTMRNKEAAVQNLFYQLNNIHDRLYKHGFTETAGNFQRDNYGRKHGGADDHVRGEVLDGSGTNNANMAVPTIDGTINGFGPRMQMYRWTYANPDRSSSLDGDIVWHEYGHGVFWRMVGDLDEPISWALNEGFADALAIVATGNDAVGEWAINNSRGIRSARYGATSKRLSSYTGGGKSKAHQNGEIYGAAVWAVREEFRRGGRSDDALLGVMIEGLNHTNPAPTFLDMRDGMLAAAGSADDCRIWRGFAKVGMGQGSSMSWSGSKGSPNVSVRESSSVPSSCSSGSTTEPAPAPAPTTYSGWTKCANEGGTCSLSGTNTVRYGANDKWITKTVTGSFRCNTSTFGRDPIYGTAKACYAADSSSSDPAPAPEQGWSKCANEGGSCSVSGTKTVRYGAKDKWVTKTVTGSFRCNTSTFGRDPIYGTAKACYVSTTAPQTASWSKCANEGGSCSVSGTKTVRYGAKDKWVTKTVTGSFRCNTSTFGRDPIYGTAKACYVSTTAPQTASWSKCANEGGSCSVSGTKTVRYGAKDKWVTKTLTGSFRCNTSTFGRDPIYGTAKACYVQQ